MALFSSRKTRIGRVANLANSGSLLTKLTSRLGQAEVLLRLLLVTVALVLMVICVEGWVAPFPYRLGQYSRDGIVARIDFSRLNEYKTELERMEEESRTPPVYLSRTAPWRSLVDELRESLFAVLHAERPSEVPTDVLVSFGLAVDMNGNLGESAKDWDALRAALGPKETGEQRVEQIVGEFTKFLDPLRQTGTLDVAELGRRDLREDKIIHVIPDENPADEQDIAVSQVLMREALKNTGRLGRSWKSFDNLLPLQPLLEQWLRNRAPNTLEYDEERSRIALNQARSRTESIVDSYKRGALLVAPGTSISEDALNILKAQHDTIAAGVPWYESLLRATTVFLLLVILATINGYYLVRSEPRLVTSTTRLSVYLASLLLAIAFARWLSFDPWRAEIIPLLCVVMILTIAYQQVLAALTGFSLTLILVLSNGYDTSEFVAILGAVCLSIVSLGQVSSRSKLIKVGVATAATYLLLTMAMGVIVGQRLDRLWLDNELLWHALRGAGWCIAAGYLVAGSLPFIESTFGVVTDISLLELSDVSHPLLQELVRRAPGTYNHSIGVATLAETAADAIGANGLLCRVGAYFHDIGKMLKPQYFVENMAAGELNRHENLAPAMSTLIIIGHVKDGADLGRQYHLPDTLIDFIEQHHGTTLVEYFFHKASRHAGQQSADMRPDVEESSFRYPGPKPQSKETGIMMLADAVEGASRTLSEPAPKRIETLVHDILLKRLLDGQFDESGLTLTELAIVEDSLVKSLISIYHGRIKYPDQKTA
ncbi:MAG: phosphohydrolase [Planctomyces sp.]|nr:phosphohydrolase [Planctomyces sp.]